MKRQSLRIKGRLVLVVYAVIVERFRVFALLIPGVSQMFHGLFNVLSLFIFYKQRISLR